MPRGVSSRDILVNAVPRRGRRLQGETLTNNGQRSERQLQGDAGLSEACDSVYAVQIFPRGDVPTQGIVDVASAPAFSENLDDFIAEPMAPVEDVAVETAEVTPPSPPPLCGPGLCTDNELEFCEFDDECIAPGSTNTLGCNAGGKPPCRFCDFADFPACSSPSNLIAGNVHTQMDKAPAKAAEVPSERTAGQKDTAASTLYIGGVGLAIVLVGSLLALALARGKGFETRMPTPPSRENAPAKRFYDEQDEVAP